MKVKILHLYYDLLNLYGEYGNILIMKKHLEDQGFEVELDKKTVGDDIDFEKYDFVYIGGGMEKNLDYALEDLKKYTKDINLALENKKVFLCTGNSFEMFGKSIDKKEGLCILDYETVRLKDRVTSDVIYKSKYFEKKVVGFVNKMTEMYHNMSPLFEVYFGVGENNKNDYEGVKYLNLYGTHVSGPILARNPEFLKKLVSTIGQNVDSKFVYKDIEYKHEEASYTLVLSELEKRKEVETQKAIT